MKVYSKPCFYDRWLLLRRKLFDLQNGCYALTSRDTPLLFQTAEQQKATAMGSNHYLVYKEGILEQQLTFDLLIAMLLADVDVIGLERVIDIVVILIIILQYGHFKKFSSFLLNLPYLWKASSLEISWADVDKKSSRCGTRRITVVYPGGLSPSCV